SSSAPSPRRSRSRARASATRSPTATSQPSCVHGRRRRRFRHCPPRSRALRNPPDVAPVIEERERLADELRGLGIEPLPSRANFLFVAGRADLAAPLLAQGLVVRTTAGGIRITVRDRDDDDLLLAALAGETRPTARRARYVRATAETA